MAKFVVPGSLTLTVTLLACSSSKGSFDAERAPFGERSPTTVSHSVLQVGTTTTNGVTQVAGSKTINSQTFTRVTATNASDPASGVEWWLNEKPGKSVTLAGWDGHSTLARGLVPPGVVVLSEPVTVSLEPPVGTPQTGSSSATITVAGDPTPHAGQATAEYKLVDDRAAIETSMGTIFGCKHFTGWVSLTSDLLPPTLAGATLTGEIWYHPSYGVVAFVAPELGLGMEISDAADCGPAGSDGHAILRKVGIVDSTHPFKVSTYDDCTRQLDADKDEHAKMLLELRYADDAKARAGGVESLGPMLRVEFGDTIGYFPHEPRTSQVSIFHPEENGEGFTYYYAYVSQADKYQPVNGIEYHISVSVDSGASPIRATGRIYYKRLPLGGGGGLGGAGAAGAPGAGGAGGAGGTGPAIRADAGQAIPDAAPDVRVSDAAADIGVVSDAGAADLLAGKADATFVQGNNLLVNGDAEAGIGSNNGSPVATPGWTVTGNGTALQYGSSGGYPTVTDPGPTDRGLNFFSGGSGDAVSTLTQTVSLASYASKIDTGSVGFVLSGYLGGYTTQGDNAALSVVFQDASGAPLATATIGPVTSSDRGGLTALLERSIVDSVPAGARSAVVTLTITRSSGSANDGYADNLSLTLSGV